jgi:hypothetical protein
VKAHNKCELHTGSDFASETVELTLESLKSEKPIIEILLKNAIQVRPSAYDSSVLEPIAITLF